MLIGRENEKRELLGVLNSDSSHLTHNSSLWVWWFNSLVLSFKLVIKPQEEKHP